MDLHIRQPSVGEGGWKTTRTGMRRGRIVKRGMRGRVRGKSQRRVKEGGGSWQDKRKTKRKVSSKGTKERRGASNER